MATVPGGILVAGPLLYEAEGNRVREMRPSPVELLDVEVAKNRAADFFHLRVLREAILALDGLEISLSVTRHGVLDMTDGEHRVLTM